MSTLTLLRHGQAAFGAERYDELTTLGAEQARATGAYFSARHMAFNRVLCGPRQRHRQTALFAAGTEDFLIDPALDEFAEGEQVLRAAARRTGLSTVDGHLPRREQLKIYSEQIELWARGADAIEGVADADVFYARVSDWLDALTASSPSGQNLLAVTSAGVIAAIVCRVLGQERAHMATHMQMLGNASITTLVYSSRGIALRDFNVTQHLPATLTSAI